MKMLKPVIGLAAFAAASAVAQPAFAQEIVSATGAAINSGGPGFGSITNTHNQAGLSSGYVSGVTNFNAYIATNPTHTQTFACCEWFSNLGTSSASVTYDLGAIMGIDALALWNEESSGIGTLNLWGSTDGVLFAALGLFNPIDNPVGPDYSAEVFGFSATDLRYVRFDMSNCPQPEPGSFDACAIGEVAFRTADVGAIPEPGTWAMMLFGLAGLGMALRRRRPRVRDSVQAA